MYIYTLTFYTNFYFFVYVHISWESIHNIYQYLCDPNKSLKNYPSLDTVLLSLVLEELIIRLF